ncbi:MAG TPA: transporter [Gammaproteobacteria bacterium]|nr:transporter [Gammaproteobacteria bacterium]
MKRFITALSVTLVAFVGTALLAPDAEARRLGGGVSSGMKRNSTVMKRDAVPAKPTAPAQSATPATQPQPQAAPQPTGMRKWLGPLAGLAAGLGIAALLSHFGLGEGMASFVMIALLVMAAVMVFKLLFRKREENAAMQYAGTGAPHADSEPVGFEPGGAEVGAGGTAPANLPAGFDAEGFVRQAKLNFIRLQAANDRGDLDDIKNFTTPEMFAEIQMQYAERGRGKQETDVQQLDASVLDVSEEDGRYIVSVRFFGHIREEVSGPVEALDEVWHLTKPVSGDSGWLIAGIQQFQ